MSSDESKLGIALQAIADANQDEISGVAMCTDYVGAEIFVAQPTASVSNAVAAVQAKYPNLPVTTVLVAAGLTAELAAERRVTTQMGSTVAVVAPDIYAGGLSVTMAPSTSSSSSTGVQTSGSPSSPATQQVNSAATANGTVSMPVKVLGPDGSTLANFDTRLADSQPYKMGDRIYTATVGCSAGVPIIYGGVRYVLTAGHCTGSTWYNDYNLFGTQYTTAYPGNADIYGDWKLLGGQTYKTSLYSGAVSSSSQLSITGANWSTRPYGYQMCTSGDITGSICRYFVFDSYASITIDGVTSDNQNVMFHDSTGTGNSSDSNGAQGGDSGGPCYYSDGAGGAIVAGTLKGGTTGTNPYYYCTQLSGVRAWKSSVTVG